MADEQAPAPVSDKFTTGREAVEALPKSIRVGPFDIEIEAWDTRTCIASPRWGEWCPGEQKISLTGDMPAPMKAVDTFVHEVNHAIYSIYGIAEEDKEERIVGMFARGWAQIYRDNPAVLEWLAKATRSVS